MASWLRLLSESTRATPTAGDIGLRPALDTPARVTRPTLRGSPAPSAEVNYLALSLLGSVAPRVGVRGSIAGLTRSSFGGSLICAVSTAMRR